MNLDPNVMPKSLPVSMEQPPSTKAPILACEQCKRQRALLLSTPERLTPTQHTYVGRYGVRTETEAPVLMFYQFIYECCDCGNRRVFGTESV